MSTQPQFAGETHVRWQETPGLHNTESLNKPWLGEGSGGLGIGTSMSEYLLIVSKHNMTEDRDM